jgi:hypothetical protein
MSINHTVRQEYNPIMPYKRRATVILIYLIWRDAKAEQRATIEHQAAIDWDALVGLTQELRKRMRRSRIV